MKIVNLTELRQLPEGTIFSFLNCADEARGLCVKKRSCDYDDFFYSSLLPYLLGNGNEVEFNDIQTRHGTFDLTDRFIVYASTSIVQLK